MSILKVSQIQCFWIFIFEDYQPLKFMDFVSDFTKQVTYDIGMQYF